MRMPKYSQAGFGAIGVVMAVVVVAVVGFGAYKVMNMNPATTNAVDAVAAEQQVAPSTINTKADLQATSKSLDQSSSELNSNLDDGTLDSDVDAVL